jgi:hypothetical protein
MMGDESHGSDGSLTCRDPGIGLQSQHGSFFVAHGRRCGCLTGGGHSADRLRIVVECSTTDDYSIVDYSIVDYSDFK